MDKMIPVVRWLLRLQGAYYFITAVWPLVHIESFMYVTGPKTDIWLVKTVGVLILAVSIGMLLASFRRHVQPDVISIAVVSAIGLGIIDLYYAINNVIWDIYLMDAIAEALLVAAWAVAWWEQRKHTERVH